MKAIEFKTSNFTQITGQNKRTQLFLKQVIEWCVTGHRYTEMEIESLWNQELIWKIDGKEVKKNEYQYLKISTREDLIFHLSGKKGSLAATYFNLVNNNVDVIETIDKVNELLELISLSYKKINDQLHLNFDIQIKQLKLIDITQQLFEFSLIDDQVYCSEFIDSSILLEQFIKILSIILERTEFRYVLVIENISSLISYDQIENSLIEINDLSQKSQLIVFNFGILEDDLLIQPHLLESILICGDSQNEICYDWNSLRNYLNRNYPCLFNIGDKELLEHFKSLIPYLLSHRGGKYIRTDQGLVLFILLNEGFYFYDYKVNRLTTMNTMEWEFLEEKLYK